MKHSRVLITITLSLGLTLALLWILSGLSIPTLAEIAGSNLAPTPPSLTRQHAPVVITGGLLSELAGSPLDEIFVYAYRGATLAQIPSQIDERETNGRYVAVEDGQLDDNDELVFMAVDGGGWIDYPSLDTGGTPITPTYVITLTDPLSDTHAWAYVFCSDALSRTFSADYVSYDGGNDRITSPDRYAIGFNATYAFQDYLTLCNSDQNLLDRSKLRVAGMVSSFSISANEQDITKTNVYVVDGPVRVTRISTGTYTILNEPHQTTTTLFAYRSLVVQLAEIVVQGDPIQTTYHRNSMDWNAQAGGMTYYDANTPAGVTIDGLADVITITPPSRWTQVTGLTGTVVNVSRIPAGLGGTQSTYYKDDSTLDSNDTGDQRSYGDAGLQIDNPNPGTYPTLGHTYFLTGTTTNVGATYLDYYNNPLRASVATFTPLPPWISLTAIKNVASVYPGETATYTLLLTASEGFNQPVTLSLQGMPSSAIASFDPNPLTPPGTSQLSLTTAASAMVGTYAMTVTGTSGQVTGTTLLTLTINPILTLTAQPAARAVLPGNTAVYTLSASASEGFNEPVTLTLQGAPYGAAASFDPNPLAPPGASQLTITTTASTAAGTYVMTVTGSSDQVMNSTPLTLTINPTFTLTARPIARAVLPGDTAVYTLSTSVSEGFVVPVTLTLQGAPYGAATSFDPNPITSPDTSQLHITTTAATTAGTYPMTITGTSRVFTHTTHSILIVASVTPSFTLSISPTTRIAEPNQAVSYTVTISGAGTLGWPVTLTVVGLPTGVGAAWSTNPVTPDGFSTLTLSIPNKPSYGDHLLQVVGTVGTQVVAQGIKLIIAYPFKTYLPKVLDIGLIMDYPFKTYLPIISK